MTHSRRTFLRQAAGLLGVLASSCSPGALSGRGSTATREITIGATFSRTGDYAAISHDLEQGFRLWAEEVNVTGGLLGRPVKLALADDQSDGDAARDAYRQILPQADVVLTPYGSYLTGAVLPLIEAARVPGLAPAAADRSLWTAGRQWTVQMLNPADSFLEGAVTLARARGARRVATLYRPSPFVDMVMAGARAAARRAGMTVTAVRRYQKLADIETEMRAISASDIDLLLGGGFEPGAAGGGFLPDAVALARALRRARMQVPMVTWLVGSSFPGFGEALGAEVEGMTGNTAWKPLLKTPGNPAFITAYRRRWGAAPDAHAAQGYAAGQVIGEAIRRAGSLSPTAVRDALFRLEMRTVFGRFQVSASGLQIGKVNAILQWQEGDRQVVWPPWLRTAHLRYRVTEASFRGSIQSNIIR
ncbi:MAG: ABC transporter substrate-binding protein [Candidatus Methylomirabilales bacterium]